MKKLTILILILLVLLVTNVHASRVPLIGANYNNYDLSNCPDNMDDTGIIHSHHQPGVRETVQNQLYDMRYDLEKYGHVQSLRVMIWFMTDIDFHTWGVIPSEGGVVSEPYRTNLINYVKDIKDAGFEHLTITFSPQWNNSPHHENYDGSKFNENWNFMVDVRGLVKQYGPTEIHFDLYNEGAPSIYEGSEVFAKKKDYIKQLYSNYVAAYGKDDVTFSVIGDLGAGGIDRMENLILALDETGLGQPNWYEIHTYNGPYNGLKNAHETLNNYGLNQHLVIGETYYNNLQSAQEIQLFMNHYPSRIINELNQWPLKQGETCSEISLPFKITEYREVLGPIKQHIIGVRLVNGDGEFYDKQTGEKFVPRGNNYIRLAMQDDPWGGTYLYHSTFDPDLYNPAQVNDDFTKMNSEGYNVVRVFINELRVGDENGGLSQAYLANVADFLEKAKAKNIYTLITLSVLPKLGGYYKDTSSCLNIEDINTFYFCQIHIDAKKGYVQDFIKGLINLGAPLDYIFSYNIENEACFHEDKKPLSLLSGQVTTANGVTYDMSNPDEKQQMMDANLVYWINQLREAVLEVDPTAMVAPGFFSPKAVEGEDARIIRTHWAIADPENGGSSADYIDLHAYPGFRTWEEELASFEISTTKKPLIQGEFGALKSKYPNLYSAYIALRDLQVESCQSGFDGWLLWTWDTDEQTELWNGLSEDGQINKILSPNKRSNPCSFQQGDVNNDRQVDIEDLSIIGTNFGKTNDNIDPPEADLNNDNVVNILDLYIVANNFGT